MSHSKVVARWPKVGSIIVKPLQGGLRWVESGKVVARWPKVGSIMVESLQGGLRWVQSW